jgi:hypothetical protein
MLSAFIPVAQAEEKFSDYPLTFKVQTRSVVPTEGCFMWLTDGQWSYSVENHGLRRCHTWPPGTVLHAKFANSSFIQCLDYDEQGKLHKYNLEILQKQQLQ